MANQDDAKWNNYAKFTGLTTVADPSKIDDGATADGQNSSVNESDKISSRPLGYKTFSTPIATPNDYGGIAFVSSMHTFRKRKGENIMMRQISSNGPGGVLEYLDAKTSAWQILSGGFANNPMGYADVNQANSLNSYVVFCDSITPLTRWNGAHANFLSASNMGTFIGSFETYMQTDDIKPDFGYVVGDVVTINGGTAKARIISVANGAIGTVTMTNPGHGYTAGDQLILAGPPAQVGIIMVDTVDGAGVILTFHLIGRGVNYVAGTDYKTVGGSGEFDVNAHFTVNTVLNGHVSGYFASGGSNGNGYLLISNSSGYAIADTGTTGGSGSGLVVDIATLASNTITVEGTTDLSLLGFYGAGSPTSLTIGIGNPSMPFDPSATKFYTYTGYSGNTFFGVSPDPTVAMHAVDSSIFQVVEPLVGLPRGNLLVNFSNRLFIGGVPTNTQQVYFSAYGSFFNFSSISLVSAATATASGILNLGEGGGNVTDFSMDENTLYIYKQSIIYKLSLADSYYVLTPLKPFDGRSQTIGAQTKTVFIAGNMVFFATPDNQIAAVDRLENIDYPQYTAISYPIRPTIINWDLTFLRGVSFSNRIYISAHSTQEKESFSPINSTEPTPFGVNDRVLVWNINTKSWDTPIVGWNVAAWTIYNDGNGDALYFGSNADPNVYKVTGTPQDGNFPVIVNHFTKRHDFGLPAEQKECTNFYLYGRIAANTTLTVKALLDEAGFTQIYTTNVLGTDTVLRFGSSFLNTFGASPFGVEVFGSNPDSSGMNYFRVYLVKGVKIVPFYNIQLEFISQGQNQQWEILDYGFEVAKYNQPQDKKLYKPFS